MHINDNPIKCIDNYGHAVLTGLIVGVSAVGFGIIMNSIYWANKSQKSINKMQNVKNIPDKINELNEKLKQSVTNLKKEMLGKDASQKIRDIYRCCQNW